MGYIGWGLVAMVGYGITAVLIKSSMNRGIVVEAAVVITNVMLVVSAFVWATARGVHIPGQLSPNVATLLLLVAGTTLSVSIISLYKGMSLGPISTVLPIFAMNIAVASMLGIVVLGESLTLTKVVGIALAAGAVFLLTR